MLWSTVTARAMHVLNGCSRLPAYTCTTCQRGHIKTRTTVDYVILNDMAQQLTTDLVIEDHPPRQNAKNFHAHLAVSLKCRKELMTMEGATSSGRQQVHWVPGMEDTWREWTDTLDFANGLASIVTGMYAKLDALN